MDLQERTDRILARLRAAGTDLADVEVKKSAGGAPKSLPESISAFSNGTGGFILLGLDENSSSRAVPVDAGAQADAVATYCREALEPATRAEIDIVQVDGLPSRTSPATSRG
jgi:ATP-dependent DNA helicase RecG